MQSNWNNPQQASKGTRFYSPGLLVFWGLTKILQGGKGSNQGLWKGFQAHLNSKQIRRKGKRDPNMPGTITLMAKALTAGATTGVGHLSEGDGPTCLSVLHLYLPRGKRGQTIVLGNSQTETPWKLRQVQPSHSFQEACATCQLSFSTKDSAPITFAWSRDL